VLNVILSGDYQPPLISRGGLDHEFGLGAVEETQQITAWHKMALSGSWYE
jgi:hypothetical protein